MCLLISWDSETGDKEDRNDSKQELLGKDADPNGVVIHRYRKEY